MDGWREYRLLAVGQQIQDTVAEDIEGAGMDVAGRPIEKRAAFLAHLLDGAGVDDGFNRGDYLAFVSVNVERNNVAAGWTECDADASIGPFVPDAKLDVCRTPCTEAVPFKVAPPASLRVGAWALAAGKDGDDGIALVDEAGADAGEGRIIACHATSLARSCESIREDYARRFAEQPRSCQQARSRGQFFRPSHQPAGEDRVWCARAFPSAQLSQTGVLPKWFISSASPTWSPVIATFSRSTPSMRPSGSEVWRSGVRHWLINPFNSISSERAPLRVVRPPSTSATA